MKPRFAFALIFFIGLRLAGQDVTVSGPSWVDPSDPPDQLPVTKMDTPDYPERLNGSTEIGYVVVDSFIFAEGKHIVIQNAGTDPLFDEAVESLEWRAKPARRDGKKVNSVVQNTIIFNPACASKRKSDATPRLLGVVVPELPSRPGKNTVPPSKLYVTASVDASGQVTKAVADAGMPEALGQLAEDAVLKWTFAPARKNGQPVAQDVRVPVVFLERSDVNAKADAPPRATYQVAPVYPLQIERAGQHGLVNVRFVVDIEGRVRSTFVTSSTNPGLDQPAIDAVLKWRFEPGRRNGVPVNVRVVVPIAFNLDNMPNGGNEAYEVSDRHIDQSKVPPELRYDIPPKPANTVFAVYPFELLRDRVGGTAEVRFLVGPGGDVEQAIVIKATRPEFGQALVAMLDEWKFQPAMKDGKPTSALLDVQQEFSDTGGDVPVSDEADDLMHELRKDKLELCPLKDLDARPQLISPHPPVFPSALIGKVAEGKAVVEFLIDHDGNVQLPRVVSATDPAFGYAAVQGVSAWKFAPLTSHGKPVVMRAQIPIEFHGHMPAPAAPPAAQN
jgi:TonB family protein